MTDNWRIVELASVGSTQVEAAKLAAKGELGPLWVRADEQSNGRGRSGRDWETPAGNFAATLMLRPDCEVALLPQLSLVAGIAVADAVNSFTTKSSWAGPGAQPALVTKLKWPNDLLIDGAKLGGILVETSIVAEDVVATIGIGLNLAFAPALGDRAIARLADHVYPVPTPTDMLTRLAPGMQRWLEHWDRGRQFASIRTAWLHRSLPEGKSISVNPGDGPIVGTFAGLDTDGALLLLEPSGRRRRFSWGDVSLRPQRA